MLINRNKQQPLDCYVEIYYEVVAEYLWSLSLHQRGISADVKHRPREHVLDDAGHSSGAITDRYIDVELRERAKSAKQKKIL